MVGERDAAIRSRIERAKFREMDCSDPTEQSAIASDQGEGRRHPRGGVRPKREGIRIWSTGEDERREREERRTARVGGPKRWEWAIQLSRSAEEGSNQTAGNQDRRIHRQLTLQAELADRAIAAIGQWPRRIGMIRRRRQLMIQTRERMATTVPPGSPAGGNRRERAPGGGGRVES